MRHYIYILILLIFCICHANSQSWTQKLNGIAMWSLCTDLQGNIYAGASGTVKSIYKSTDGGNTWNPVLQSGLSNFLYLAADSSGNIYAANVSNGMVKSTDGGATWTTILVSVFGGNSVEAVACGKNGYIYAGTINGGIYRSTNYGATFPDTSLSNVTIVTLVMDNYNSNRIFAGASSVSGVTGFFLSTNAGSSYGGPYNTNNSWGIMQKSAAELYMITTTSGYPFTESTNGGLNWATVSAQPNAMRGCTLDLAGNMYISGNGGVFKSTDNGLTFNNYNFTNIGNQSIHYQNKILVAATGTTTAGIWVYVDSSLVGITQNSQSEPVIFSLKQNYPNPFNPVTEFSFDIPKRGAVKIEIFDAAGKQIATLVNQELTVGSYKIKWDASNYPSGVYFCRMNANGFSESKKMILLK